MSRQKKVVPPGTPIDAKSAHQVGIYCGLIMCAEILLEQELGNTIDEHLILTLVTQTLKRAEETGMRAWLEQALKPALDKIFEKIAPTASLPTH